MIHLVAGLRKNRKKRFILSKENTKDKEFNKGKDVETHYLPDGFLSPLVIWIYGDSVAHAIWEDTLTVFRMRNKNIADDYKTYYEYLKRIATI